MTSGRVIEQEICRLRPTGLWADYAPGYSKQAVWVLYIRKLIHFKTFYKENKRNLQHQGERG